MRVIALLTLVAGIAGAAGQALADDTVSLSQTPDAVQKVIQAHAGDGKIGDITKDADGEETVYDVGFTDKQGTDRDFSLSADGTLLSVEVPLEETPAAVQRTIRIELNGGDLDSIDKNLADSDVSYDVEGSDKNGKEKDFTVYDDGTLSSMAVDLDQTPEAVQKTIAAHLNGQTVQSIDENFDDDGTNFDVTISDTESFNILADGTLDSEQVAFAHLPGRVKIAIRARLGDGVVLRVDKSHVKEKNVFPYEIEGEKDGKPFDFSIGPHGRFLGMDD